MAGEWHDMHWGDLATLEYGKGIRGYEHGGGAYRVFGTNGPIGWHDQPLCHHPTVIIGRKGAYRGVHYSGKPCFVIDTAFYLEPRIEFDMRWAYYELLTHDINNMDSGSAIPSTSRDVFYRLPVRVPTDIEEQRAIAHILGTLDDKIELNRRMNETLEAIARALFHSWFVAFDPVRRNIERKGHGQPSPAASRHPLPEGEGRGEGVVESTTLDHLFPDRLVDSELGEIPEGWEVGALGDVAEHPRRSIQPTEIRPDTPYIALEHMPKRCIALSEWGSADALESNKFVFKRGEILFGKLRPYFHKVGVAPVDGVCSTDIVVVAPTTSEWFGFVLGHVSSIDFVEYTNAGSTGTKMPRTSWNEMSRYELVLPPVPVARVFTELVLPSVERIIGGIHESRTLAALRDAFLPELMSGNVRLRVTEDLVGSAL